MPTSFELESESSIRCEALGKRYRIGARQSYQTLRESVTQFASAPLRWFSSQSAGEAADRELWAVRDVSFEVRQGEVLGIIGRNGSGKSTLLKVLSGITRPTTGRAEIRGRIGTLLEVGAGFHPELTGRENIFLNGAILGMKRAEITRRFDEIVEFSECARMLDTPIKRYSSGMYVRLAFAVAAHLETEVLLVDEVLAVGDAAFQKKCLGRIGSAAHEGRTVVFVSHNLLAVDSLCSRAICLHEGRMVMEGKPEQVTSRYLKSWLPTFQQVLYEEIEKAPGNELIRLRRASVRPRDGAPGDVINVRSAIVVEFEYWKLDEHTCLDLGAQLFNEYGVNLFTTGVLGGPATPAGLLKGSFEIPPDLMNCGTFQIYLTAFLNGTTPVAEWEDIVTFEVQDVSTDARGSYLDSWPGAVRPNLPWKTIRIDDLPAGFKR